MATPAKLTEPMCQPCWERKHIRVPATRQVAGSHFCQQCFGGSSDKRDYQPIKIENTGEEEIASLFPFRGHGFERFGELLNALKHLPKGKGLRMSYENAARAMVATRALRIVLRTRQAEFGCFCSGNDVLVARLPYLKKLDPRFGTRGKKASE